jgi:hypothetical protein
MAKLCITYGLHYANLTEHVKETQEIKDMAADAETGFIPKTGLKFLVMSITSYISLKPLRKIWSRTA